jgi:xeroderma pigmentosum group C-complementing protein
MKWVKQRASTVNKRREIEMALERGRGERAGEPSSGVSEEEVMQGLYAESQTELYIPEPIIDVRVAHWFFSLSVNLQPSLRA